MTYRLNMEREIMLQRRFGQEAVCGYLRQPIYVNEEKRKISGMCALTYKRYGKEIPMRGGECPLVKLL